MGSKGSVRDPRGPTLCVITSADPGPLSCGQGWHEFLMPQVECSGHKHQLIFTLEYQASRNGINGSEIIRYQPSGTLDFSYWAYNMMYQTPGTIKLSKLLHLRFAPGIPNMASPERHGTRRNSIAA